MRPGSSERRLLFPAAPARRRYSVACWWPSISIKNTYSHSACRDGLDSILVMLMSCSANGGQQPGQGTRFVLAGNYQAGFISAAGGRRAFTNNQKTGCILWIVFDITRHNVECVEFTGVDTGNSGAVRLLCRKPGGFRVTGNRFQFHRGQVVISTTRGTGPAIDYGRIPHELSSSSNTLLNNWWRMRKFTSPDIFNGESRNLSRVWVTTPSIEFSTGTTP